MFLGVCFLFSGCSLDVAKPKVDEQSDSISRSSSERNKHPIGCKLLATGYLGLSKKSKIDG